MEEKCREYIRKGSFENDRSLSAEGIGAFFGVNYNPVTNASLPFSTSTILQRFTFPILYICKPHFCIPVDRQVSVVSSSVSFINYNPFRLSYTTNSDSFPKDLFLQLTRSKYLIYKFNYVIAFFMKFQFICFWVRKSTSLCSIIFLKLVCIILLRFDFHKFH